MAKKEKLNARKLALTILIGVFIAIMVITLFNLLVGYVYEEPKYENYCNFTDVGLYPVKMGIPCVTANCTYLPALQAEQDQCVAKRGQAVFNYNVDGCAISLKRCDMCQVNFENATKGYNRNTFFVFAVIGFALIVFGLFVGSLLLQIIALPAGAFLVIEAAVKNFDDKLYVIITFALLIIAATYLALKKLR